MTTGPRRGAGRLAACAILLAVAACAGSPPESSLQAQPALAQLAQPWVAPLRAANVTSVEATGRGALVHSYTAAGAVYTRYPEGLVSFSFVLAIDPDGVRASANGFDPAQAARYKEVLQVILPDAIRAAESNNRMAYDRANPDR